MRYVYSLVTSSLLILLVVTPLFSHAAITQRLYPGDQGPQVQELQSFLAADPTIYPAGIVSGIYGALTTQAVQRFQIREGLDPVGFVGQKTLTRIGELMKASSTQKSASAGLVKTPTPATSRSLSKADTETFATAPKITTGKSTAVEGELLTVIADDFKGKKSATRFFLRTADKGDIELFFPDTAAEKLSNNMVRVQGLLDGKKMGVKSSKTDITKLSKQPVRKQTSAAAVTSPQQTAVIGSGVNLSGVPTNGLGISYGQTLKLHSLPASTYKIYLDFTGHVTTGTNWNSYWGVSSFESPAFDMDGDNTTFSEAELNRMQMIWQQTAELYASFNIDVTTEDPGVSGLTYSGSGDTTHGIRAVLTSETGKNYGGITYNGSFNYSVDTPAFVYTTNLGNDVWNIVVATAHEVGHSVGLAHDGQGSNAYYYGHGGGATSWAPVMGVAYGDKVMQWSKGEYYAATNPQDDLAVITTNNNGVAYRADDAGNTVSSPTPLTGTTASGVTSVSKWGIIGRSGTSNDVDVYSLNVAAGGSINLSVVPGSQIFVTGESAPRYVSSPYMAIDTAVDVYDSSKTKIATFNDIATLNSTINLTNLAGGTYYVAIDGVGWGDPMSATPSGWTEYGSVGQYMITGTYTSGGTTVANPPTVNLSVNPTSVTAGQSTVLSWTSTDATSCSASGGWTGTKATSGSETVTPTVATTYSITCTGAGGSATGQVSVAVQGAPTVSLSASPTSITAGQSTTLSWSSANASSCTASGGWSGTKAVSGSETVAPTVSTTYTITCTGAGGSASKSVAVSVGSVTPAPTVTLSASPTSITAGQSTTLSWSSANASSCTASGGWSGTKAVSGSEVVMPSVTTTYSLTCTGTGGSATAQTSVTLGTGSSVSLKIGDRVKTTTNVNVRTTAGGKGKPLCGQKTGALGTIIAGPQTPDAYTWWQIDFDTSCDGWVAGTYLASAAAAIESAATPVTFTQNLAPQSTGEQVSLLQTALKRLNYFSGEVTGYFGNQTAAAVSAFQQANNLEPVGAVGPKTRELLNLLGL